MDYPQQTSAGRREIIQRAPPTSDQISPEEGAGVGGWGGWRRYLTHVDVHTPHPDAGALGQLTQQRLFFICNQAAQPNEMFCFCFCNQAAQSILIDLNFLRFIPYPGRLMWNRQQPQAKSGSRSQSLMIDHRPMCSRGRDAPLAFQSFKSETSQ